MTTVATRKRASTISLVGGVVLDLANQPLEPGEHEVHVYSGLGGVKVIVPRHVRLQLEGGSLIGSRTIRHDHGPREWPSSTDPSQPTAVRIVVWGIIASVNVCRV